MWTPDRAHGLAIRKCASQRAAGTSYTYTAEQLTWARCALRSAKCSLQMGHLLGNQSGALHSRQPKSSAEAQRNRPPATGARVPSCTGSEGSKTDAPRGAAPRRAGAGAGAGAGRLWPPPPCAPPCGHTHVDLCVALTLPNAANFTTHLRPVFVFISVLDVLLSIAMLRSARPR